MYKKSLRYLVITTGILLLLTGCGIFPKEEEFPEAPIIRSYETDEYKQATVMRGDLSLTKTVNCRYIAAKQEELAFNLGGEYIEGVYVIQGQQVKAGELLAELQLNELDQQIDSLEYEIRVLEMKKAHIQENLELELQLLETKYSVESEAYQANKAAIDEKYRLLFQDNEDSYYIERLRLQEQREELNKRQIYSSIDGTVISVKDIPDGQRSVEGQTIITIADMSTAAFTVNELDAVYFPVGTEVVIQKGSNEYMAVSVNAAALGLENESVQEGTVYLQLTHPDPSLESGDAGRIRVVLDARENVLYVNADAIKTANGKQFVYVLDENGLKAMKDISVGLKVGNVIEILSGLEEGDSVILD